MLRQVSSRNQRSKGGIKMKNAVQACLLVVICFWLLYQMRHSHEKKSYEEQIYRDSSEESQEEMTRFGRKVLPGLTESNPTTESEMEEKDKENVKPIGQEKDVHNQERTEENVSLKESITHAEKNDKDVASIMLEDQEHDEKSHESREKSFRGDDASSEVFHNSQKPEHEESITHAEKKNEKDVASFVLEDQEHEKSHESREKSFRGDDASSEVFHNSQKPEHEESITHAEKKSEKDVASFVLEDQEHEKSHESREKSFRGDDASSEVFHNSQKPEHDEPSHEAQERRFKGDDAASAVEHITESKESGSAKDKSFENDDGSSLLEHFTEERESEPGNGGTRNLEEKLIENMTSVNRETDDNPSSMADSSDVELLNTFGGRILSPGKGEDDSPPRRLGTVNVTAHGAKEKLGPPMHEANSSSGATNEESDLSKEQYMEVKTVDTKQQIYPRNSVDNQTDVAIVSTDISKEQFKLQMNSSALSQGQIHTKTMSVNPTPDITYLQKQLATSHVPQAKNDTIIIRIPGENFSLQNNVSDATDVPEKSDTSADETVESSKAPSARNVDGKTLPIETSTFSLTMNQKEAQGYNYQSNLQNIQIEVNATKLEAAE